MRCAKNECMIRGRCSYPSVCVGTSVPKKPWTGPRPDEIDAIGQLKHPVPPERWPYGPPDWHEPCCTLRTCVGVTFCDCKASSADVDDDGDYGVSA